MKISYKGKTPLKLRKFGDALVVVSAFIAAYGAFTTPQVWQLIALGLGCVGKFITVFFSED